MSKDNLIPELRFPEFVNSEEWDTKELSKLGELINGLTYNPDDVKDKGLLVLRSSNIQNGMIDFNDCVYVREDIKGANLSMPSDILVCVRNGSKNLIGKNAIIPKGLPFATHGAFMTVFRAINPEFVFQLFQTDYYDTQVKADLGATINSINGKNFLKYEFPVPENLKEQQKIASCLSSLNEVIAARSQKLDLLKDRKKGLMQNLFPQEGEKVPKCRFKEFENDGEWVFESFDRVYSFLVTNSYSREFLNYENGTVKNIHYGDIHTKFSTLFDLTKEKVPFINPDVSTEKIRKECYCKEGDMIFADASEDLIDVGKSIEIINLNNESLLSGLHTLLARQIEPKLITGFGGHLFLSDRIRKQIKREAQGSKVLGISGTRISKIRIYYPKNRKEQQKIASCLSSLDALITTQAEKIDQLKLHKKGLMQGLFPKID